MTGNRGKSYPAHRAISRSTWHLSGHPNQVSNTSPALAPLFSPGDAMPFFPVWLLG
ncbi:hypothetical protein EDWATA_02051 [Edwardsiella tarda ATCC 23685]|uniref:Uncharacterized protein n=1 Tax=Edwardsiella tarda ATCC 23685 TaxID=500638 RepID=D4F5M3_EDWTA|nr:hypothetical protein EDWATA_02051 [Edwardsiella tarda ATCC 23685]